MTKIKLSSEDTTEFRSASAKMGGAQIAVQTAIQEGSKIIGESQQALSTLWEKLGEENSLDLENDLYRITEDHKDGYLYVEHVPNPKDKPVVDPCNGMA